MSPRSSPRCSWSHSTFRLISPYRPNILSVFEHSENRRVPPANHWRKAISTPEAELGYVTWLGSFRCSWDAGEVVIAAEDVANRSTALSVGTPPAIGGSRR